MRLDEIGQLLIADVKKDSRSGIWHFDVNLDNGKSTKNPGSVRLVPIHNDLIRLGLLDYANRLPDRNGRLFPELRPDTYGVMTGNFSKWFGRYLRTKIGITDKRKVFHSFRHTFITATRSAHITEEMHNAITGHKEKGVSASYGHFTLQAMQEAIQRVRIDGLPELKAGELNAA